MKFEYQTEINIRFKFTDQEWEMFDRLVYKTFEKEFMTDYNLSELNALVSAKNVIETRPYPFQISGTEVKQLSNLMVKNVSSLASACHTADDLGFITTLSSCLRRILLKSYHSAINENAKLLKIEENI